MKLLAILRFELAYQARRPWPWLAFAVLFVFAFENTRTAVVPVTLTQDFILNSPFTIATVTVFSCMIWLLVASPMAGEAAARDVQTGMHPLAFTAPVSKAEYLGGRFLAALVLNALVLLGVQAGLILGVYAGGVDPSIIGPFRPEAYLAAYAFIALPNAVIATTIQFSVALFSGRSLTSYFGSLLLLFFTVPVPFVLYFLVGQPRVAKLMDPIGMIAIMNEMMTEWTIVEKNVRLFTLEGPMLWNRMLWLSIALATLAVTHRRFRFAHRVDAGWLTRITRRFTNRVVRSEQVVSGPIAVAVPRVQQRFDLVTRLRQTVSTGWSSFWTLGMSPAGLFLLAAFPLLLVLVTVVQSEHWGVTMVPRTGYILAKYLTAPITFASDYRLMVPLLIVFFAGELVWRERDARISDNVDAMSVPDWVLLLGKFLGLALLLAAFMVVLMLVGMTAQVIMGYYDFEIGLYLGILFGLQLPEYLLFALLAMVLQVVINQKYVALLVTIVAYVLVISSGLLGIHHHLLVYGSGPGWSHTDIRGFGRSLGPWAWFKLYWAAWALLLGVVARLLWVRGREAGLRARLSIARLRFTRATASTAVLALGLILLLGGFIFYNTNVLNEYITDDQLVERRAEYERQYGKYEGIPQPQATATKLNIEVYPRSGAAIIRGSYRLVNRDPGPIASVHLEPAFYVDTRVTFDRPAREVVADKELGHSIYELDNPLQPGDSLVLSFEVAFAPRGFRNSGASTAIVENGSYFTSGALPVVGYQPMRELWSAEDRRKHGLPRQVTLVPPGDIDPNAVAGSPAIFEATISTDQGQVAVAPGELRRSWTENGRSYFQYASDVPISGMDVFFSADYLVHRERLGQVDLQVFVHPAHAKHLERLLRGVRASLDYYSSQFGAYPYRFLQVVEQPGNFLGMGVDGSGVVTGGEGMFLLDPQGDGFDVIFEVTAHEMGHQWWGMQLKPAFAEGGGVISESLAWYSAMQLVKRMKGREALRRFMSVMREPNPWPPINTGLPLLRAMDPWANYRKGPYAMHALSEYAGEERVNQALRTLVEKKVTSLATTMDMYRELQAVTPDSLKPLLHDLFEANTFWTFDTKGIRAERDAGGGWRVTLDVSARKTVTDSAGPETVLPMDEWVEIGLFAAAEPGEVLGKPVYVRKHRIRSGSQTITLTVPERPARGGIDPYNLLDWEEGDNIEAVEVMN
jgi:ABC-2 type transport system permease protein